MHKEFVGLSGSLTWRRTEAPRPPTSSHIHWFWIWSSWEQNSSIKRCYCIWRNLLFGVDFGHSASLAHTSSGARMANGEWYRITDFLWIRWTWTTCVVPTRCNVWWSLKSCDLTPLDFFLWGFVKLPIYQVENNIVQTIGETESFEYGPLETSPAYGAAESLWNIMVLKVSAISHTILFWFSFKVQRRFMKKAPFILFVCVSFSHWNGLIVTWHLRDKMKYIRAYYVVEC